MVKCLFITNSYLRFTLMVIAMISTSLAAGQYPQPKQYTLSKSNPNPDMTWRETTSTKIRVAIADDDSETLLPVGYVREYYRNVSDIEIVSITEPREITVVVQAFRPENITFLHLVAYQPSNIADNPIQIFWSAAGYAGASKLEIECKEMCAQLNEQLEEYRKGRKQGLL